MNTTLSTTIRVAFSLFGLAVSIFVLMLGLVSIQAMSGSEPFREPLIFFTVNFAVAFGLGAVCSLPLMGRYGLWPTAVAFASGGAIGGGVLASALQLITVFQRQLRAFTDGGPLGGFKLAATVIAFAVSIAVGMLFLRMMTRRRSALSD